MSKEENKEERKYGLVWEDNVEEVEEELKYKTPILKEEESLRIYKGEEYSDNLLIEGDNLESLTYLKNEGRQVDVIYIDPPYNSLHADGTFVYKDRRLNKEDKYRHSSWLSFMEKRLKIARELLTEDGIIFLSIDDREQAQLKLLCDAVFGEANFVATIHWRKNRKPHNAGNTMSVSYEFIHVYSKGVKIKLIQEYDRDKLKKDDFGYYTEYPVIKADKKERTYVFPAGTPVVGSLAVGRSSSAMTDENNVDILDEPVVEDGLLVNDIRVKARYCLTNEGKIERLNGALSEGRIFFNRNGIPKEKRYRVAGDFKTDTNHWDLKNGKNEDGNQEIKDMFGVSINSIFSYPKPVNLIQKILKGINNKSATVLDFFAGSGTTGHAVLELNKEDGGNRDFILCTNNENNICRDVTYQRLNKVINGYKTPKGKEVEGIPSNLKYYKTEMIDKSKNK